MKHAIRTTRVEHATTDSVSATTSGLTGRRAAWWIAGAMLALSGAAGAADIDSTTRQERMDAAYSNYRAAHPDASSTTMSAQPRGMSDADCIDPRTGAVAAVKRGVCKTGHAMERGVQKAGHAIDNAGRKTGDVLRRAGEKMGGTPDESKSRPEEK